MHDKVILLLNLAVLVTNFFVSLGATETQARVLRTTARVAYSEPIPPRPPRAEPAPAPPPPRPDAGVPTVRLVKFLARVDELDRLTSSQVEALFRATRDCNATLARGGEALRGRADGSRARALLGDMQARVRRRVASRLRAADVPEGDLLARLVRIVVASAG